MKLTTFHKILNWFEDYFGDEPIDKVIKLYEFLKEEKNEELEDIFSTKDLNKILKIIGETLFVEIGYLYFNNKSSSQIIDIAAKINEMTNILKKIVKHKYNRTLEYNDILDALMNEIVESNYTKKKEQSGLTIKEIVRGMNRKEPNINSIINEYLLVYNDSDEDTPTFFI